MLQQLGQAVSRMSRLDFLAWLLNAFLLGGIIGMLSLEVLGDPGPRMGVTEVERPGITVIPETVIKVPGK